MAAWSANRSDRLGWSCCIMLPVGKRHGGERWLNVMRLGPRGVEGVAGLDVQSHFSVEGFRSVDASDTMRLVRLCGSRILLNKRRVNGNVKRL